MMRIILKMSCSMLLVILSQVLFSQDNKLELDSAFNQDIVDKEIELTFNTTTSRKVLGSATIIDVAEELKKDQYSSLEEVLKGKIPGLFNAYNIWGTGSAAILVDGIRQSQFYINSLNPMEIESVVLLKDALSKAMYGAQGDQGIILITTKRGKIGQHKIRVSGKYSYATPRATPKFLNAADYMERYNEAQLNDGVNPSSLRYPQNVIDATRSRKNPTRFPDNDFYSNQYIRDYTNGANVFVDVMGGEKSLRYYVNTTWNRNNGWLNTPQSDITDNLNFRGNVDFAIGEYLNMNVSTSAGLSFNTQPNADNIWRIAATELPNNYPILWDPSLISNLELRDNIVSKANLINGQLLGGNSSFLNNIYGTLTQNGKTKFMQRDVQFNGKLDIDMRFITKGLSASLYGGMNFFNTMYTQQNPSFAIYEPVFDEVGDHINEVIIHGVDKSANMYHVNNDKSDFFRHISYYGTLNYNRSIENHDLSITSLLYADLFNFKDQIQKDVLFHTGVLANYMYFDKYIAEISIVGIGSQKMEKGNRVEMAPSFGLGWVISEEDFLPNISFVDYLKIRSSYGISKNDNWDNYNLYRSTFMNGSSFSYNNGIYDNRETYYLSIPNNISLQKRRDFTIGIDAILFDKSINVNMGYFNSSSYDNITLMSSTYPQILGYEELVYNNYNSSRTQGLELGLNYNFKFTKDFSMTAGSNLLYISPKTTKIEEPIYEGPDTALLRKGAASDAMWGLKSNGLYSEDDFNSDGTLVSGLPVPTFGAVRPGDIKYLDQNGDNIIDDNDRRIVGHGLRTQYSIYLDFNYKNIELYILGIAQNGGSRYRSGSYYRVFGDVKYSVMANEAYGPNNKDVYALHPRLSTTDASNNNRSSDYWLYKDDSFVIPSIQLTYRLPGMNKLDFIKESRVYIRANNAFVFGKNKKYTELNVNSSPQTRSVSIGFVTSF